MKRKKHFAKGKKTIKTRLTTHTRYPFDVEGQEKRSSEKENNQVQRMLFP